MHWRRKSRKSLAGTSLILSISTSTKNGMVAPADNVLRKKCSVRTVYFEPLVKDFVGGHHIQVSGVLVRRMPFL